MNKYIIYLLLGVTTLNLIDYVYVYIFNVLWCDASFTYYIYIMNFVLVIRLYATCSFSEDTVVLYIMQLERQFPLSGHLDGCLQLHVFLSVSMMFFFNYFCIMCFDDLLHISCAPIADFYIVF